MIDKIYTYEQTNDALKYVESGRTKGKVVIKMKGLHPAKRKTFLPSLIR
ncbi:zinc-binding dehydrogenase [Chryseobacterium sp. StRB126]|nr:zinc-binding dehydrogenase [Chryseobacterium sp. StRB126]